MRRLGVLLVVSSLAVSLAATSLAAPHYIVNGIVGPGGTIALKNGLGEPYKSGSPGMYIIRVTDKSSRDGFRLLGPGVNVAITGVGFVGARTLGVTLRPGIYIYRSDAHPRSVRGTFVLRR